MGVIRAYCREHKTWLCEECRSAPVYATDLVESMMTFVFEYCGEMEHSGDLHQSRSAKELFDDFVAYFKHSAR
jgi:hypothetical protein